MVVVTVDLWPGGQQERAQPLGRAEIANDGTGAQGVGHYRVRLFQKGKARRVWRTTRVTDFPRKRLGAWDLLCRALMQLVGDRNMEQIVEAVQADLQARKT